MDSLTKVLLEDLLEVENKKVTAIYGGGFKPPTKGHYNVVEKAAEQNPEIDDIIIYVGGGERDGITQGESIQIWEIYKKYLPLKTTIEPVKAPIGDILRYAKEHPDEEVLWIIGARENNPEDFADIASRTRTIDKYPNLQLRVIQTSGGVSGTAARKAVRDNNKEQFFHLIPDIEEKEQVWDIVSPVIKELVTDTEIICDNCGWEWKIADGGGDLYICHKCGHDNTPKQLNENATYSNHIDLLPLLAKLTQNMINKGYKIEPLPGLKLIDGDTENAKDFFGKTAYYDPIEKMIVLYTEGRHPKDIARSYAHEMIHHMQNLEGRLGDITTTDTTEDSHLEDIEKEAYLKGNISFRNWTDDLQEKKDPFGINAYARELALGLEEDLEEGRKKKPDPKKGTGKKPEGSGRRLYTDEDPKDTVRIKFKTKEDIVDTLNKKQFKAKSHARQSQVINLIHQRVRAAYGKAKDPEVKARLKRALDYIEARKEASKKKTERLRKMKEASDPQAGTALPYGSGFAPVNEGAYDSIVSKLSKDVINAWKSQHDAKPTYPFAVLDTNYELEDAKGRPLDFDLLAKIDFKKTKDRNYKVDGGANEGDDEVEGFISLNFQVDPRELPQMWSTIAMDVRDVLRHEIEHLTQGGWNVRNDKEMADDQMIRDLIQKYKLMAPKNYFLLDKEVDAMLQGMYFKAKKSRTPFTDVINDYLDKVGLEPEEKEEIKDRWRSRLKALSLPMFESKYKLGKVLKEEELEEQKYIIYCDMDGVLVDFDKGYKELTGTETHHADTQGKEEFWGLFKRSLANKKMSEKDYWANLQWMPDGKELWDHIKQYKPTLLSAPSRDPQSRWGKRIWVKKNIPGTPLILAAAPAKKNYARKNAILIDDKVSNINEWNAAGGIGILHTSTATTLEKLSKYGL